jgi:hypothetical protein
MPAATDATNVVPDWQLERDRARKEAMDWFQSFYTSAEMIKVGYKVRCPLYDLAYRQGARPVQFGIEYDVQGQIATYDLAMAKWNAVEHPAEDAEYKPMEPLTPATYSFLDGPNQQYEDMAQVAKFDRVTLFNIVMAHAQDQESLLRDGLATESHAQLVQRVQAVIEDQSAVAEMAIEYNPVLELVSGILVLDNWKWLSVADLTKWNLAVDPFSLARHFPKEKADGILEEQVRMYKEILAKRWGDDSARGYNLVRARCQDNQKSLGRTLSIQDEPDDDVREKLTRQEAVLQQMVQSIPNGTPAAQVAQELLALVPTTTLHRSLRKRKVEEAAASSNKEARSETSS